MNREELIRKVEKEMNAKQLIDAVINVSTLREMATIIVDRYPEEKILETLKDPSKRLELEDPEHGCPIQNNR